MTPSVRAPVRLALFVLTAGLILTAMSYPAHAACSLGAAGRTERVEIAGTGRGLQLRRPAIADEGRPLPLVLALHGSTMTGAQLLSASGLESTADRHGFVLVAPDAGMRAGPGFAWAIPGVPTVTGDVPGDGDPDDTAYLLQVVDALAAEGCIDPARVYVTGLSGGGRMASWLACTAAERFAAIAPVVGLRAGNPDPKDPTQPAAETCQPNAPMPIMAFAGDSDPVNPTQGGGAAYWSYTMHAAQQRWAQLNGCTAAPVTTWVADGVYEERYGGCRDGADVVGRITVGGGHDWRVDEDAMWTFLAGHSRAQSRTPG